MSLLNEALRNAEQRQHTSDAPSPYTGQSRIRQRRRKAPWARLGVAGVVAFSMAFGYWLSGTGAAPDTARVQASTGEVARAPEPVVVHQQTMVSSPEQASRHTFSGAARSKPLVESPAIPGAENTNAVAKPAGTSLRSNNQAPVAKEALPEASKAVEETPKVDARSTEKVVVVANTQQQHATAEPMKNQPSTLAASPAKAVEQAQLAGSTEQTSAADVRTTHTTPDSRDRAAAMAIRDAIANGRIDEAQQAFAEIINVQNAPRSRAQWVRHLLVTGDFEEALSWAPANIALENNDLRLFRARAQFALGQVDAAIATLQSQVPAVDADPDYAVTLATLLQQDGQYSRAASLWAELIAYDDDRSAWWVGLAIALESEQRLQSAARAYAQALELPDLSASLRDFVLQRLRAFEVDGSNG